jgi:hypothetical protein
MMTLWPPVILLTRRIGVATNRLAKADNALRDFGVEFDLRVHFSSSVRKIGAAFARVSGVSLRPQPAYCRTYLRLTSSHERTLTFLMTQDG